MKNFLTVLVAIVLTQTSQAQSWQYMPQSLPMVQQGLNKDLYAYKNVIVNFSLSKNHEVADLQIFNNICPAIDGGIACLAMPALVLKATFNLTSSETDSCGVKTFVSNKVEVGSRFMKDQHRFAQIRVKDFSKSMCEMYYISDVQVELKDTILDTQSNQFEIYDSTLFFNYLRNNESNNQ